MSGGSEGEVGSPPSPTSSTSQTREKKEPPSSQGFPVFYSSKRFYEGGGEKQSIPPTLPPSGFLLPQEAPVAFRNGPEWKANDPPPPPPLPHPFLSLSKQPNKRGAMNLSTAIAYRELQLESVSVTHVFTCLA
eukprot:Sspe_Gene.17598::Locus_6250_Transcript_1_1_Confidence_1.000_Length_2718::g.17598::m.17598